MKFNVFVMYFKFFGNLGELRPNFLLWAFRPKYSILVIIRRKIKIWILLKALLKRIWKANQVKSNISTFSEIWLTGVKFPYLGILTQIKHFGHNLVKNECIDLI